MFNGDIGRVVAVDHGGPSLSISFVPENRVVEYRKDQVTELDHAFAITVHKSQGSEFDVIIMPVLSQHFRMLFRNLLYTGLTRAKKLAVFVGTRKALAMAVHNRESLKRQTGLIYQLGAYEPPVQTNWATSALKSRAGS